MNCELSGEHFYREKSPQQLAHFSQWGHPTRGWGNTSINMILDIVGISEIQKCVLKYDMYSHYQKINGAVGPILLQ